MRESSSHRLSDEAGGVRKKHLIRGRKRKTWLSWPWTASGTRETSSHEETVPVKATSKKRRNIEFKLQITEDLQGQSFFFPELFWGLWRNTSRTASIWSYSLVAAEEARAMTPLGACAVGTQCLSFLGRLLELLIQNQHDPTTKAVGGSHELGTPGS